jgi:hypothetical protein
MHGDLVKDIKGNFLYSIYGVSSRGINLLYLYPLYPHVNDKIQLLINYPSKYFKKVTQEDIDRIGGMEFIDTITRGAILNWSKLHIVEYDGYEKFIY